MSKFDHMAISRHVGEKFKAFRTARGLSEATFEAAFLLPRGAAKRFEQGRGRMPVSDLCDYARLLDVKAVDFFEGLPGPSPEAAREFEEALAFARAYHAISDPEIKKRLAVLIKTVAEEY